MEFYLSACCSSAKSPKQDRSQEGSLDGLHKRSVIGPEAHQLLDMPLGAKLPLLPGCDVVFYTTNLCEKLYQPSVDFNLSDPHCRLLEPKYMNLHDPHLSSYYKRKYMLKRLKKGGYITENNKIICTFKEFNDYRQYLTTIKLNFERSYIKEQRKLEKQMLKLQDQDLIPDGLSTSVLREWLFRERDKSLRGKERLEKHRCLNKLNEEIKKRAQLREQKHNLRRTEEEKREREHQRTKLIFRKKQEEEWKLKEKLLLMRIEEDVRREIKLEERQKKTREDRARKKQELLDKKMALHVHKMQEFVRQREEAERKKQEDIEEQTSSHEAIWDKQIGHEAHSNVLNSPPGITSN